MKMKKVLSLVLALSLALSLTACGGNNADTSTPAKEDSNTEADDSAKDDVEEKETPEDSADDGEAADDTSSAGGAEVSGKMRSLKQQMTVLRSMQKTGASLLNTKEAQQQAQQSR